MLRPATFAPLANLSACAPRPGLPFGWRQELFAQRVAEPALELGVVPSPGAHKPPEDVAGDLAAAVRSAAAEAERLSRLTDDLLLLARSDEDRLSLRPAATDIGKLLARSAGTAASRLAAAGVTGHVDAQDGDAGRCRQRPDPAGGRQPH